MSTKINVIVGDQRLLQDNKTRAAANQQALDSRTQQQQLEQQATNAVEEGAADEVRSGAPTLVTVRRPAAQRRKTGVLPTYTRFSVSNLSPVKLPQTSQFFSTTWQYTSPIPGATISETCDNPTLGQFTASYIQVETQQLPTRADNNVYADITTRFQPTLNFSTPYSLGFFDQALTVDQPFSGLSSYAWLVALYINYRQDLYTCQTVLDGQAAGTGISKVFDIPLVSFNPNPFPRAAVYADMRVLTPVVTSNANAVFVSCCIKQKLYQPAAFRDFFPSGYPDILGVFVTGKAADWVGFRRALDTVYGYYSRYDRRTKTIQSKTLLLTDGQVTTEDTVRNPSINTVVRPADSFLLDSTRQLFITNMYQDDPRKNVYNTTSSLNTALDVGRNRIAYDNTTGFAYFFTTNKNTGSNTNYLYRGRFTPNSDYNAVYTSLTGASAQVFNAAQPPQEFTRPFAPNPEQIIDYALVETFTGNTSNPLMGIAPFE
jgi:hypothetical protein